MAKPHSPISETALAPAVQPATSSQRSRRLLRPAQERNQQQGEDQRVEKDRAPLAQRQRWIAHIDAGGQRPCHDQRQQEQGHLLDARDCLLRGERFDARQPEQHATPHEHRYAARQADIDDAKRSPRQQRQRDRVRGRQGKEQRRQPERRSQQPCHTNQRYAGDRHRPPQPQRPCDHQRSAGSQHDPCRGMLGGFYEAAKERQRYGCRSRRTHTLTAGCNGQRPSYEPKPGQQQKKPWPCRRIEQRAPPVCREEYRRWRIDGDRTQRRLPPAAPEFQADGVLTFQRAASFLEGGGALHFDPTLPCFRGLPGQFGRQQRRVAGCRALAVEVVCDGGQPVGRCAVHAGVEIGPKVARRQQQPERVAGVGEGNDARRLAQGIIRLGRVGAGLTHLPAGGVGEKRAIRRSHGAGRQRGDRGGRGAAAGARPPRDRQQQPEQAEGNE
ncbi:MAG: hypothetical protein IPM07_14480 [Anaerolineales bacterium]|nr:hypothetical protein [Anaerolineales bacterium]